MTIQDATINKHGIETGHERGAWMQTVTGGRFYPLDPRPEEVKIQDIAHALANQGRFNGHTRRFYSIAQHSCLVHDHMPEGLQFLGLMHDASEAYVGDMIRPIKYYDMFYQEVEDRVHAAVYKAFNLKPNKKDNAILKHWDNMLCAAEKRDLHPFSEFWFDMPDPEGVKEITAWSPSYSQGQFMRRFNRYVSGLEEVAS